MRARRWAAIIVTAILAIGPLEILARDVADQEPYPSWFGPAFGAMRPIDGGYLVRWPQITAVHADGHTRQLRRRDVLKGFDDASLTLMFSKWFFDGLADGGRTFERCHKVRPHQRHVPGCSRAGSRLFDDPATLAYFRRNLPGVRTLIIRWQTFVAQPGQTDAPREPTTTLEYEVEL